MKIYQGLQDSGMNITNDHHKKIKDIILQMKNNGCVCLSNFQCYRSSFQKLCKLIPLHTARVVYKCEANSKCCADMTYIAMGSTLCKCPLRKYIAENVNSFNI